MSNSDRNNFDINEKKLSTESNIGILATLITGFSISLLPSIVVNNIDKCSCYLWSDSTNYFLQHVLMWISIILLTIVGIISGITMIYSSSLSWHGMKILTRRERNKLDINNYREKLLTKFDLWWETEKSNRKFIRRSFVLIIPVFLFGLSLSPNIWCNNCILGLIVSILFLLSGIPIAYILKSLILKKIKI